MKKLFSVFICFSILVLTAFALPFSADAATFEPDVDIYADAYMLISLDDPSYPVVAQKNQSVKKFPASLTKIVTAMVTINKVKDLSQKVTYSQTAYNSLLGTDAQVAGIRVGEVLSVEELLYLTMVHSACDACQALAEFVSGGSTPFADEMNKYVESLDCKNTHFVNPDGLHDDNHYTTAEDMAKITLAALDNEVFTKISFTQQYQFHGLTLVHTNYMLDRFHISYYYEYAKGIKTGSTEEAGYCVITKASKDGYNYLAVVMDSPIKVLDGIEKKCSFIDAKSLFEWAFNSLKYSTVVRKNDVAAEIPVEDGKDADTVQLFIKDDLTTLVPATLDPSAVIIRPIDPPEMLKAPVTKGDKICTAEVIYADQVIANVDLVAAKTVELSTFLRIINAVKSFMTNPVVVAVIAFVILSIIGYIAYFIYKLQKDKKRIAAKRAQQEELDRQLYNDNDFLPPPRR